MLALSQLRICRTLPPLRNGYLDVKDAQCAETEVGGKIVYITTYCVWAPWASKKDVLGTKSGKICRTDWNLSDAHFVHK